MISFAHDKRGDQHHGKDYRFLKNWINLGYIKMSTYKGAFLNPSINFLPCFTDKEDYLIDEYWNEVGGVLDIFEVIDFPFKNKIIKINLHKMGLISTLESEILEKYGIRNDEVDSFAYLIFSSFCGLFDFRYLSNEDFKYDFPIETFIHQKENNSFSRMGASTRFMHAILYQRNIYSNQKKVTNLHLLFGNSWSSKNSTEDFLRKIKVLIEEKKQLNLHEEYYFLISNFHRCYSLKLNEGVLLIGWTICEYLINRAFAIGLTKSIKEKRREFFNDKEKFPWAFSSSNGELRAYKDLVSKSYCDCSMKMKLLEIEKILNCKINIDGSEFLLVNELEDLRAKRNKFVHNPSHADSLKIIMKKNIDLYNKIIVSKKKLLEIIKNLEHPPF